MNTARAAPSLWPIVQSLHQPRLSSAPSPTATGPQALWHLLLLLLLAAIVVPQTAESTTSGLRAPLLLLLLLHRSIPRLRVQRPDGLLRWRLGVRGQPWREGAAFLCVVVSQHAGDVRVVFGVAVGFRGEECRAEIGDL